MLQYSRRARASFMFPVPRFTAIMMSHPALPAQRANSSVPMRFGSMVLHARSILLGLSDLGPIPSLQSYPETKLPPGYLTMGTFSALTSSRTSVLKPSSSAQSASGSQMPPYTALPRCSMNDEKSLSSTADTATFRSSIIDACFAII